MISSPYYCYFCTVVKSKGKISQNCVAFSEYMNFRNVTEIYQKCQKHRENVGVQALFCSSTISVMFLANFSFKWQTNQTSQIKVLQKFVKPPSLKKGQQREMKTHIKNLQEI